MRGADITQVTLFSYRGLEERILVGSSVMREQLFWAMRLPLAAESDMRLTAKRLQRELGGTPDFGLCFPCMGRGPYFYGGVDRDLQLIQQHFSGMPLIGFYGNGEIAPFNKKKIENS